MLKVKFNLEEKAFLASNECCRIASCHNNIPHVVPVSYIFEDDLFYFASDYNTTKYRNIVKNNRVALVIDVYRSIGNKAVCIQGKSDIIESGEEFSRLYEIFYKRFEWVRMDPWKENEAAIIKVIPTNKTSWGL
jgi:uncharacterized protein